MASQMKRLRISRCTGQLLNTQARTHASPCLTPISFRTQQHPFARHSSNPVRTLSTSSPSSAAAAAAAEAPDASLDAATPAPKKLSKEFPSPLPEKALQSAKLAALHARLSLPEKLPLQTLARTLVDPSADPSPNFNNANLAVVGGSLISYHVSEWLIAHYPRLPMAILYEAMRAYAGSDSLYRVASQWGVESAAAPGGEVDPGLLQWSQDPEAGIVHGRWGYVRKEHRHLDKFKWRRSVSSRVVLDDEFGDVLHTPKQNPLEPVPDQQDPAVVREQYKKLRNNAHAAHVRAVTGALYAHAGRDAVRSFIDAHILSRRVELEKLFSFKLPTRELAMLCAREGFEAPVARLESETGRLSRTPVYVVGIYSGRDKLGEGTGASLDFARLQASMNALKAWYLYSPGAKVRVPSDMLVEGAKPWQPVHIDMGEII
ncbi:54S ribosomal protein L3 [Colletotrichum orchidophilum]|uniref:Large ribosomal subunit protein mL44 n=1 Tax=Colletotrichum orchidophilum TaxID=1209926 RepID=A0A1G4B7Q9_9PEZI|nr:54S ribosomal protein L3 [Colletotrichum orchidophilum]OHE97305.1 54S ribosomal protein L3 [Colletotrichum orchidophilum]